MNAWLCQIRHCFSDYMNCICFSEDKAKSDFFRRICQVCLNWHLSLMHINNAHFLYCQRRKAEAMSNFQCVIEIASNDNKSGLDYDRMSANRTRSEFHFE